MSGLDDLKRAHGRVQELRARGMGTTDHEFKAAMNRLMSLIRHASPEEVATFDAWRRAQSEGRAEGAGERHS